MKIKFAVQIAGSFCLKAITCGGPYPNEHIKHVFAKSLLTTNGSDVRLLWDVKIGGYFMELALYYGMLLKRQHGKIWKPQIAQDIIRAIEFSSCGAVVAVAE